MAYLAAGLFLFWYLLSGLTDGFHLGAGAIAAVAVALGSRGVFRGQPRLGLRPRWLPYLGWLGYEIVLSAVRVARIILAPRMRIAPDVSRFADGLPHAAARAVLAHSITLTPGTVTLDSEAGELTVHQLDPQPDDDLAAPGHPLRARVARLYR